MEEKYGVSAEGGGGMSGGEAPSYDVAVIASKKTAVDAENELSAAMREYPKGGVTTQFKPYAAPVASARELHAATSDRSCVHVEFDIAGTGISYQHGDHLGVFAENAFAVVQRAAACLGLSLDHAFALSAPPDAPASLPPPFPTPCTLATVGGLYSCWNPVVD
jgi:NADPH-ferrihemoprotein reductase